jgi:diacylglycerol kinase (ATP)
LNSKVLFIVNPVAGRGRSRKLLPKLKEYLRSKSSLSEIYLTEKKGSAREFVNQLDNQFSTIVSVGGDGTLNEILNGLKFNQNIKLAIIPCGSGNDFANAISVERKLEKNIQIIFNNNSNVKVNIGEIIYLENIKSSPVSHYFINSCGIGFDALVAHLISKRRFLVGLPLYLSAVIEALFNYIPIMVRYEIDNFKYMGNKLLISIGNGKTSGGGFILNPFADLCDNKLDACIINNFTKLKIIKNLFKAITGKHYTIDGVDIHQFESFNVKLEHPYYLHVDGEVVTDNMKEAEVKICKEKMVFIK